MPGVADIAAVLATARHLLADGDGARTLAEAALPDAAKAPYAPVTLPRLLAHAAHARGETAAAMAWLDKAVGAARARGMTGVAMECEAFRASLLADLGGGEEALTELTRIGEEARLSGADINGIWALTTEGYVRLRVDPGSAMPVISEALDRSRRAGYPAGVVAGLRSVVMAQLSRGSVHEAAGTLLSLAARPSHDRRGPAVRAPHRARTSSRVVGHHGDLLRLPTRAPRHVAVVNLHARDSLALAAHWSGRVPGW